jgi:hypothetical protein
MVNTRATRTIWWKRAGVQISLVTAVAVIIAWNNSDLAASYVALSFGCIAYTLHGTEIKINNLLDHHRITVRDNDFD